MKQKIFEIKQALSMRLYNCALSLALTLPSVCARVEYDNTKKNDKSKYIEWFDKYAIKKFTFQAQQLPGCKTVVINTIDGLTCYKLRCAVLHAGNFDTDKCKYKNITIHGHDKNSEIYEHECLDEIDSHIDVNKFCDLLCSAVEEYYDSVEDKSKFNVENVVVLDW